MTERPKTLVLDANGVGWREQVSDSVLLGLVGLRDYDWIPTGLRSLPVVRGLKRRYEALSYVNDWRDALTASPRLDVTVCSITNLVDYSRSMRRIAEFDLVVVLHSALGDSTRLLVRTADRYRKRSGKLAVFIGNEYDLMAEKLRFLQASEADYVCTQLPLVSAQWLYAPISSVEVLAMPHALNPDLYRPNGAERVRDIGFIGAVYPAFIGDIERTMLMKAIEQRGPELGLRSEFRAANVPRAEWAAFLNESEGTVGAESGSYYLDREGLLVSGAKTFLDEHPDAPFEEVYERFFAQPAVPYVSGKCISSRHFEAVGTKTCQILLEGEYNGILQAGEHYIGITRDLSNLAEAVAELRDDDRRRAVSERAYEHVLAAHTYAHRIESLLRAIGA